MDLKNHTFIQRLLIVGILTGIYFIAGKIGLKLAFVNSSATAVWPPTGISIASFLLFGYRVWPAIFVGAFFVNLTTTPSIPASFGIALGNTLEGLVGGYLVTMFANGWQFYDRVENIFRYIVYALIASIISATIGVTTLLVTGFAQQNDLLPIWVTWWLGDLTGAILVAPFIISLLKYTGGKWGLQKALEVIFFFLLTIMIALIVFGGILYSKIPNLPLEVITLPLIVLVALRFSQLEVTATTIILSIIAISSTLGGYGPFARASQNESLLLLQVFMGILALTGLCVSALVSERKKTEEIVESHEKRYRTLVNLAPDIIYSLSDDGKFTDLNPAFEKITGWKTSEWLGKPFVDILHPDYVPIALEQFKRGLKGEETLDFELKVHTKFGHYLTGAFSSVPRIENGKVAGKFGIARDITYRKQAEEMLQTNERLLKTERDRLDKIINALGEAVVVVDINHKITLTNPAAARLLSLSISEIIGQDITDVIHLFQGDKGVPLEERLIVKTLTEGKEIQTGLKDDYYYQDRSGRKIPVTITTTPLFSQGKITAAVNLFRDVTYEKDIEKLKTELFSITAHQLRTPLTHIRWNIEMLIQKYSSTLSEPMQKGLNQIYLDDKIMIELLNKLLKVIRLEQKRLPDNPEQVNVVEVITKIIKEHGAETTLKSINVELQNTAQATPILFVDRDRLTEVLENLISNAIKFTNKGHVTIILELQGEKLHISVKDEGIGIPRAEQGKIFSQFFRAENAMTNKIEGSGLGLYLVKNYIENWGGIVWFESEEGKGSAFHINLPLKPHIA